MKVSDLKIKAHLRSSSFGFGAGATCCESFARSVFVDHSLFACANFVVLAKRVQSFFGSARRRAEVHQGGVDLNDG